MLSIDQIGECEKGGTYTGGGDGGFVGPGALDQLKVIGKPIILAG
jgi:hypothetical protein